MPVVILYIGIGYGAISMSGIEQLKHSQIWKQVQKSVRLQKQITNDFSVAFSEPNTDQIRSLAVDSVAYSV